MRRLSRHIECLAPAPFMLLIGAVGGVIQGIPRFFLGSAGRTGAHLGEFVLVAVASVLWWAAALLLWWIAVRRRRWSIWKTAGHVTVGLALANVLDIALATVVASIETNGVFAGAIARAPLTFASPNLVLVLIRSPLWFLGSAMLLALGRHLAGGEHLAAPSQSQSSHPEAVT